MRIRPWVVEQCASGDLSLFAWEAKQFRSEQEVLYSDRQDTRLQEKLLVPSRATLEMFQHLTIDVDLSSHVISLAGRRT